MLTVDTYYITNKLMQIMNRYVDSNNEIKGYSSYVCYFQGDSRGPLQVNNTAFHPIRVCPMEIRGITSFGTFCLARPKTLACIQKWTSLFLGLKHTQSCDIFDKFGLFGWVSWERELSQTNAKIFIFWQNQT